ncbi:6-phosphogluconate dehydrogenase (decarboxylating) [Enterococcus sp. 8G7_MSG3316]|uniref:6-phosphogluconate dehydrogenase (Decarboxylating) n=1 Tax=Candidatus Enterococcus testudinis TaxID=1834191 RepID=A0A242A8W1_9ENTE|nr:decarboxylating 6-phosphogluconate dehydrogenase [Enterococcus sp. 8G7_MSG3316]OTN77476.1 6-phosphogluconate dehydrogenase (decarboxylating) [Enterococcus sp. 8G7_MSG3316]
MEVGIIGLGKMGLNLAMNLTDNQYQVIGMDISEVAQQAAREAGISTVQSVDRLVQAFSGRRIFWLMLPAGEPTEHVLKELFTHVESGDIIIEGGNTNYKDSIRRAAWFKEKAVSYFDCGTSGGISGARNDACLMIGGEEAAFREIEGLFIDIATENGYLYAGPSGSGHFLKMVHNGIEYGMMQSIGEGFQLIEQSAYGFDLATVAKVWNHGSVIRSWLMEIAEAQFSDSPRLAEYRGIVAASGEAKWTVETALDMNVAVPTIAMSLFMRNISQEEDNFSAKVVAALRNGFGGHEMVKK